jgi:hypothetical protein
LGPEFAAAGEMLEFSALLPIGGQNFVRLIVQQIDRFDKKVAHCYSFLEKIQIWYLILG